MTIPLSSHPPLGIAVEVAKREGLQRPEDTAWEYMHPSPMMRRARDWRLYCKRHRIPVGSLDWQNVQAQAIIAPEVILKARDWASPVERKRIFVGQCPDCLTIYWTEFSIV